MSAITSELARLSGPLAYLLVAALVFGETALFFGFVLPGEIAVVLGGVLASRGRVSLPLLMLIVVAAAIIGPLVGYEVGRRMGGRVVASRFLRRVSGTVDKAAAALNSRGAVAVLVGRFTAVLRAHDAGAGWHGPDAVPHLRRVQRDRRGHLGDRLLPAWLPGRVRLRGGRAAGRSGFAIAIAALVVAALVVWAVRRHRRAPALVENNDRRAAHEPPARAAPSGFRPRSALSGMRPRAALSGFRMRAAPGGFAGAPRRAPAEGRHGLRAMKSSPRCRFPPALPAGPS